MDLEKISNLIKTKRKEQNLTQEELAKKINVTEKAISRWETGRGTPDISLLIPLSHALNLEVSELLNGNEKKKNQDNNIATLIEYEEKSKKVKNKTPIIISIILYVIFTFLYLLYLKGTYKTNNHISYLGHIIFNFIFILIILFANWNLYSNYFDKKIEKDKMNKITYIIILVLYTIMILNVTIYERQLNIGFKWLGFDNYFKYGGLNLIPFRTIIKYILEIKKYWPRYFIINIFGNIIIFMPIQFLMMKVFGKLSLKKYLIIDITLIFIIETLQFLTGSGAFDIDDIILNIFGISIIYFNYNKLIKLHFKFKKS